MKTPTEKLNSLGERISSLRLRCLAIEANLQKADWKEGDHPRADDGRFGDKPGDHEGKKEAIRLREYSPDQPRADNGERTGGGGGAGGGSSGGSSGGPSGGSGDGGSTDGNHNFGDGAFNSRVEAQAYTNSESEKYGWNSRPNGPYGIVSVHSDENYTPQEKGTLAIDHSFSIKDDLKSSGFKFSGRDKTWYIEGSSEQIKTQVARLNAKGVSSKFIDEPHIISRMAFGGTKGEGALYETVKNPATKQKILSKLKDFGEKWGVKGD